jgi:hypothetical protein
VDARILLQDFEAAMNSFTAAAYWIKRLQRLAPENTPAGFWAKYAASTVRFLTQSAEVCMAELRREALVSEVEPELCHADRCACSRG